MRTLMLRMQSRVFEQILSQVLMPLLKIGWGMDLPLLIIQIKCKVLKTQSEKPSNKQSAACSMNNCYRFRQLRGINLSCLTTVFSSLWSQLSTFLKQKLLKHRETATSSQTTSLIRKKIIHLSQELTSRAHSTTLQRSWKFHSWTRPEMAAAVS
jgi:hypothetical protein